MQHLAQEQVAAWDESLSEGQRQMVAPTVEASSASRGVSELGWARVEAGITQMSQRRRRPRQQKAQPLMVGVHEAVMCRAYFVA